MIKKIWKFLMFVLPFTTSKVKDARFILDTIDDALNTMQVQHSDNAADISMEISALEYQREVALRQLRGADAIRTALKATI